jgi:hypothetical protein
MSKNSEASNVSRRHFLSVASSVAAVSSVFVGRAVSLAEVLPPPPPTIDSLVSITVSDTPPFSYRVGTQDADPLRVKPGKKIAWSVNLKRYHLIVSFKNNISPFRDTQNKPVLGFYGTEGDEGTMNIGGTIDPSADGNSYRYNVTVFDDSINKFYSDDPKIIVGTGINEAKQDLTLALGELKLAAAALSELHKQQLKAKVEDIETEVNKVIEALH